MQIVCVFISPPTQGQITFFYFFYVFISMKDKQAGGAGSRSFKSPTLFSGILTITKCGFTYIYFKKTLQSTDEINQYSAVLKENILVILEEIRTLHYETCFKRKIGTFKFKQKSLTLARYQGKIPL